MNPISRATCLALLLSGECATGLAQDASYRKDVRPIFEMDSYADMIFYIGWPDTGALMRRLDDGKFSDGKPGNMNKYLGETDVERAKNLEIFRSWVGVGGWTMKRWEARGGVPGISREELDKIRVKY